MPDSITLPAAPEISHEDKLAAQQTALYELIKRPDLPRDVYSALLAIHSNIGDVVYDLMTGGEG